MGDLTTLLAMVVFGLILLPSFGHILGGSRLSGRILGLEIKIAKAIIAFPFVLLGKMLLGIGKGIKK